VEVEGGEGAALVESGGAEKGAFDMAGDERGGAKKVAGDGGAPLLLANLLLPLSCIT